MELVGTITKGSERAYGFPLRCFANDLPIGDTTAPKALNVVYSPSVATTGTVVVHLILDEAVQAITGRTKVSDTYFMRVYSDNVQEMVVFEDRAGNRGSEKILIDWIGMRYTAEGYVADGLIVHLDGIKNAGSSHATTTAIWKDLTVNHNDFKLQGSPNFTEKAVSFDGISQYAKSFATLDLSAYTGITVEVLYRQPKVPAG
jgi:hypothetical protein